MLLSPILQVWHCQSEAGQGEGTEDCTTTIFRQTIESKACVRGLCPANLARLYTAFSVYHSLRKLHAEQLTEAISSGNFNSVHETAIELTKLFLADSNLAT
jgi:hypothetical protein